MRAFTLTRALPLAGAGWYRSTIPRVRQSAAWSCHLLVATATVVLSASLAAQSSEPVITVPSACLPCVTRATLDYTIKGTDTPIEGRPVGVTQDIHGHLIVWYRAQPLFVFDSTGHLAARVGKVGVGPGEITPVRWVVAGRDDTVRVYANTRINIFAGTDFRYVRSGVERSPETGSWHVVRLASGATVRLSNIVPRDGDLNPIYLRDLRGELVRRFSPTRWQYRSDRALAPASASWGAPLWVAESYFLRNDSYTIMLVDTVGVVRRAFRRNPEWWESWQTVPALRMLNSMADTLTRPPTSIVAVREDGRGRLHVLMKSPRLDWKRVRRDEEYREGNLLTMIEVIDPRTRRLVATLRVVGAPIAFAGDNRFVTYREDRDGYPYLDVWRITLP